MALAAGVKVRLSASMSAAVITWSSATSATETAATVTVDNDANAITLAGVAAGTSEITVTANDGNNGTATTTFTVGVTANTPPTASDNTVTIDEDTAYTFDAADFSFSDTDAGGALASVKVTSLETAGALRLSGADVTQDQVITAADIDADNLTFTPAANANGDPYASFRFSVNDGTADSAAYTMTIDVTPVNDAPTVANAIGTQTVVAGSRVTVALETAGSEVFADVDGDTLTYSATSATETAATVTVDNDANAITLAGVAAGTSEITVTANDGNNGTATTTFTVGVTANTPPTASDNTVTIDEDTAYTFDAADFSFSDTDAGGALASVKVTSLETAGALRLSGADVTQDQVITAADIDADNLTFTPAANANGDPYASFRFSVNDGTADSAAYTMTIDVTPVNDAPTVANAIGTQTVVAGSRVTVALETAGSEVFADVDGDTLTYSATSATETAATVTVDNDANAITLAGVAAGTSEITVTANDGNNGTATTTFTVGVTANTPPTASDNTVTIDEDTAYTFDAADFSFSDTDAGGALASVKVTSLETAGALRLSGADVTQDQVITAADIDADNLTFTPAANANGDPYASFRFSVNDGTADSAAYTMTIDVTPVNDAPTVANAIGTQTVVAGSRVTVALETAGSEVFADVDGDTLTYSATSATETAATVTVDNDANAITLAGVAAGTSEITVTANDGNNGTATTTFTVGVTANTPPTASDNTVTIDEDTAYTFDAADFSFSDTDAGGALASVKVTSLETAGALRLSGADVTQDQVITAADIDADNLTFTPAANANGDPYASFRFSVNDGTADSAAYTMTIDVTPVNDAPTVANAIGTQTVVAGSRVTVALETAGSEVFADVDGDTLTYSATSATETAATVTVDNDANAITLAGVAAGTSEITVTANDGNNGTATTTFTVGVTSDTGGGGTDPGGGTPDDPTPTNNPPIVENPIADQTVEAGASVTVALETSGSEVFTDPDGDALTYTASANAATTATATVSGSTLRVAGVTAGATTITVTADDGNGGTATTTFTVTVTENNPPQVANPIGAQTVEAGARATVELETTGSEVFTDPDGDALRYTARSSNTSNATVAVTRSTVTVTGVAEGTATITVTADDGNGGTATTTFSVTVAVTAAPANQRRAVAWLTRFGRTVALHTIDEVARRMEAPRTVGVQGSIAGLSLVPGPMPVSALASPDDSMHAGRAGVTQGAETGRFDPGPSAHRSGIPDFDNPAYPHERSMRVGNVLLRSNFTATGQSDADRGTYSLWGRAAHSRFAAEFDDASLNGDVTTAMLGADYAKDGWLIGLAIARSSGDENRFTVQAELPDGSTLSVDAEIRASLTAAIPYASLTVSERATVWGAAGYGYGDLTLDSDIAGSLDSGITWTMAAAGMRNELFGQFVLPGPAIALTSDALWVRTALDEDALAEAEGTVSRFRLGLEGSWAVPMEDFDVAIIPKLTVGLRHDGGDTETGTGVELGGGLTWSAVECHCIEISIEGRTLVAHEAEGFEESGYSVQYAYFLDPVNGFGPSLTLRHDWGGASSGGLNALFAAEPLQKRSGHTAGGRYTAEAAFGLPAFGGQFAGGPEFRFSSATGTRDYGIGWYLTPANHASDLSMRVMAIRNERRGIPPEHGVQFVISRRW